MVESTLVAVFEPREVCEDGQHIELACGENSGDGSDKGDDALAVPWGSDTTGAWELKLCPAACGVSLRRGIKGFGFETLLSLADSYEFDPGSDDDRLDAAPGKTFPSPSMAPGRNGSTALVAAEDDGALGVITGVSSFSGQRFV